MKLVVEIIQALVPLGSMHLEEALPAEVARVAGERFWRCDGQTGHVRWSRQWGSVCLAEKKLPLRVHHRFFFDQL